MLAAGWVLGAQVKSASRSMSSTRRSSIPSSRSVPGVGFIESFQKDFLGPPGQLALGVLGVMRRYPAGELLRHGLDQRGHGAVVLLHHPAHPVTGDQAALLLGLGDHLVPGACKVLGCRGMDGDQPAGVGSTTAEGIDS